MTNEELATPPTALEVAQLLAASTATTGPYKGVDINSPALKLIRRLAFDWDRLQAKVIELEKWLKLAEADKERLREQLDFERSG